MSVLGVELDRRKHIHFLQLVTNCFSCCWGTWSDSNPWFGTMFYIHYMSLMSNVLTCGYLWKDLVLSQFLFHLHIHSEKLIYSNNTHQKTVQWYLSPFTWILQNALVYYSRRCFLLSFCLKNIFMLLLDIFHDLQWCFTLTYCPEQYCMTFETQRLVFAHHQ